MAVAASDPTVSVVDAELGSLVSADLPAVVDRVALGVVMTARATCAAAFNIPPSRMIGYDVVAVRSSLHLKFLALSSFVMHHMTKSSCDWAKKHAPVMAIASNINIRIRNARVNRVVRDLPGALAHRA